MVEQEKKYKPTAIARMFGLRPSTVIQRFASPYAEKRWGVTVKRRKDGSIERYVPESNLHFWKENPNYVGRPVFSERKKK
jgi:hypothetical protein